MTGTTPPGGPPLRGTPGVGPPRAEAVGRTIDLMTLNVWGLPWPIARSRGARFRRIHAELSDAALDIVGLQELWGRTHRLLERLAPHRPADPGDSGLALAGALQPLEPPRLRGFSRGRGADRLKKKGVMQALVSVPLIGELRVLVTHLQAGARHAAIRAHQVDELLTEATRSRVATVLMGDFNLYEGDPVDDATHDRIVGEGFADAAIQAGDAAPTYCSRNPYVGGGVAERFDRVYLRSGPRIWLESLWTRVRASATVLSDHHPLAVRVRAGVGRP